MIKNGISTRKSKFYKSIEKRLEVLTKHLLEAEVCEKSIDLVKEIKELHALLKIIKSDNAGNIGQIDSKVILVWGDKMHETEQGKIFSEKIEYDSTN